MKNKWLAVAVLGAGVVTLGGARPAHAVISASAQVCQDAIQNKAKVMIGLIQGNVRKSVKNNVKGTDSKCSQGRVCLGGLDNGSSCASDADCGGAQAGVGCYANSINKGLGGAIAKAKAKYRVAVNTACAGVPVGDVGFPNSRCPAATDYVKVADCVIKSAGGDIEGANIVDTILEPLCRGAGASEVQPDPTSVCGTLGSSVLQIGSISADTTVGSGGGGSPLDMACTAGVCTTQSSIGADGIDHLLAAPTTTLAGTLAFCLVTFSDNAGNGTAQSGSITITGASVGLETSFSPIHTDVYGGACPKCQASTLTCDTGDNAGGACLTADAEDIACPPAPSIGNPFATVPNPFNLSTEAKTLDVPGGKPGFCGHCDDQTIGCQTDANCTGSCLAPGCCTYSGTEAGFHGDAAVTHLEVTGVRGPYCPHIAGLFCTGQTGNALVDDSVTGLPGPVRFVQPQLNSFRYKPGIL